MQPPARSRESPVRWSEVSSELVAREVFDHFGSIFARYGVHVRDALDLQLDLDLVEQLAGQPARRDRLGFVVGLDGAVRRSGQ